MFNMVQEKKHMSNNNNTATNNPLQVEMCHEIDIRKPILYRSKRIICHRCGGVAELYGWREYCLECTNTSIESKL